MGMFSEPQPQHEWLQQLVGTWSVKGKSMSETDGEQEIMDGVETVRSLGGLWIVCEADAVSNCDGKEMNMQSIMTLGYDLRTQRYVGTWIGSPMDNLFVYDGEMDEAGKVLTLSNEGPDCMGEGTGTVSYRDVIEIIDNDTRTMTSYMQGEDGNWTPFMQATYTRSMRE